MIVLEELNMLQRLVNLSGQHLPMWCYFIIQKWQLRRWERKDRQGPPPALFKHETIKEYATRYSIDIFVETGTYLGRTVYAMRKQFSQILSIELDKDLYEKARKKFSKYQNIKILHGDSKETLAKIVSSVTKSCLFWLDAHYSGGITARGQTETPIVNELETILRQGSALQVILIDDARCFTGEHGYPTITQLKNLVRDGHQDLRFEVKHDIIRIHR
jgi:tRNA G46 methylase TrmB